MLLTVSVMVAERRVSLVIHRVHTRLPGISGTTWGKHFFCKAVFSHYFVPGWIEQAPVELYVIIIPSTSPSR